jgi:hypothetical protein
MVKCWILVALLAGACSGDAGSSDDGMLDLTEVDVTDDAWTPPPPVLWPDAGTFATKGALAHRLPGLAAGPFVSHVTEATRPEVGRLAGFGVGNGRVFALLGYPKKGPLNTLHGLVGPTYERGERFFGDYAVELVDAAGTALPFEEQWVARDATDALVLTRGRRGDLELDTVDLAPPADHAHAACVLRLVTWRNTGTLPSPSIALRVRGANPSVRVAGATLTEASNERALTTSLGAGVTALGRELRTPAEALEPGAETTRVLTHCTVEGVTPPAAWSPSVDEALLLIEAAHVTATALRESDARVHIDTPDPRVTAFLTGMHATIATQTSLTGATCPMSQYTRTWARDNIGPMLYLLDVGDFEAAARLLDYVWGATLISGDLQNSYDADLDLAALPAEPDWESLGELAVRVGAETPSYLVILYGLWWRASGDLERARERWGLLRRAMFDVRWGPDRLLPWTGDETFRAAMNAAFGLGVDAPHHDLSFSLNSNILWLAAAKHFVALAEALGETADAEATRTLAAEMEATALPRYLLADGCLSALIDRETLVTWPAPFEDASLTPTWAGWLPGDDPRAVANVTCLIERLGREPGVLQSPPDPLYVNFPLLPSGEGLFTGMKPGYTLAALTDVGHPDAEAAFNALRHSLDAGGNVQEYLLFSTAPDADFSGLSLFYNEQGLEPSDYTAKFRPWEGGIDADAAFAYLTGWQPDVPARRLALRPHLPNGWAHAGYSGLRAGEQRFDLRLERPAPDRVRVVVRALAGDEAYTVALRWDAARPVDVLAGEPWPEGAPPLESAPTVVTRFGQVSTIVPDLVLPPGQSLSLDLVTVP